MTLKNISLSGLPTLSVALIVRNEEENLKRLLSLLKGAVDEIVVCDTGSVDDTIKVAKEYGAVVVEFPWNDNFSDARNYANKHCTKDYILWLDADDDIIRQDLSRLKLHLKTYPNTAVFLVLIDRRNDKDFSSFQLRVFPNHQNLEFRGRVHEQIAFSVEEKGIPYSYSNIEIIHFGYRDTEEIVKKLNRNLFLLEKDFEENPDDFMVCTNMAKTLLGLGQLTEAEKYTDKAIKLYEDGKVKLSSDNIILAYINKITLLSLHRREDEAIKLLEKLKVQFLHNALIRATLGEMYFRRRNYTEAYKNLLVIKDKKLKLGLTPLDFENMAEYLNLFLMISSLFVGDFRTAELCIQNVTGDVDFTLPRQGV